MLDPPVPGRAVEAAFGPATVELRYGVGWGDCLSGCFMQRWWTFDAARAGSVEYRGVEGPPLPSSPDEQGWGVCGLVGEGGG